ncbi:LexA family protein [Sphingobium boeckii]|uniref:SOS-response transcriptional repressor LexA n=1 Tax=Sphingobium boeckii TaxID=1082345 RepID=A0A7W9AEQ4_9SPHN|nr:S24 family peptidase [Sphingobium boeckii]MBB5684322.1 SOS-response transcriptional repressor LexA [Sphingobium boeckii]
MRFQLAERVEGGIPAILFATQQCVVVDTSQLRELALGEAWTFERGTKPIESVDNHGPAKSISQYALQSEIHTGMCFAPVKCPRMDRTPDEKREILRRFILDRDLKVARWAKDSGVDKNSIYNFINGHSQSLDLRTYAKLARTTEVPVWKISGDMPEPSSPTAIWVSGHVEAGMFREAVSWDQSLWYSVDIPVPGRFRGMAKALEVRGNSMNLEYPSGSVVIWVDMLDFRPPRDGDHVIVYSHCSDDTIEATVKELRIDEKGRWLWPRSDDPLHQAPLDLMRPPQNITSIEIKGIVIGGYKARVI